MAKFSYGGRPSPETTLENMEKIKGIFAKKELVTFKDMQKATKHKWVRGFFNALKVTRPVEAVRKGRKIIGYRFKTKKRGRPANDNTVKTQKKQLRKVA